MKILKHKNIMGIIYGILLLMPFLSILARTCYVVVNKNAYQSYSNEYVQSTTKLSGGTQLTEGLTYYAKKNQTYSVAGPKVYYSDISIDWTQYGAPQHDYNAFYTYANGNFLIYYDGGDYGLGATQSDNITEFSFTASQNVNTAANQVFSFYLFTYKQQSLDNAFEYSVSQFIEDNNFGKVNLFNWFTDLFLDNNAHNNMYVHYINWYLNYSMLVSCMHLLFLVLMWFVNYSKRLLDRGMNYDW